nr:MAG TPA: hypothetical protein [Bacteriophage sp.]
MPYRSSRYILLHNQIISFLERPGKGRIYFTYF